MYTEGEGESGMNGEASTDIHTPPSVKHTASGDLQCSRSSAPCSVMTERGGRCGGGREAPEGRDICIHMADS